MRDQTEEIADTAFIMSVLHNHVYGNFGASGVVAVLWEPGESPKLGVLHDRYNPKQEYSFSNPGCDWSSF